MQRTRILLLFCVIFVILECTFGAASVLKCAECETIVEEIQANIVRTQTGKHVNDTILVEIRKKKIKVPYAQSQMSVMDAVDGACDGATWSDYKLLDDGISRFYQRNNDTAGETKKQSKARSKGAQILKKACHQLVDDHEEALVEIFHKKERSSHRHSVCTVLANVCEAKVPKVEL
mmetsp:Transcript_30711/g.70794  ORF Transcript_30711/g.70794 Transcript_30711/m.70794 type:complete len:176 (+) Transcript_30711:26-553(+)|eukprot:CAMPEP_0114559924 /NCGR_PEP_ID=MMETSP0114-20121206/11181_1 /TAXON_ID=31324 /ORGANISM="Goniomonas sp, Strain m" /LENGTH=175 /DNA_ID=CAMNT_0001745427 /DNA_START=26 /DNA_END=553 /DNA_ORIENTATION=-